MNLKSTLYYREFLVFPNHPFLEREFYRKRAVLKNLNLPFYELVATGPFGVNALMALFTNSASSREKTPLL